MTGYRPTVTTVTAKPTTRPTGTHLDVLGDVHLAGPQVAQA